MDITNPVLPTIHRNGTGAETLAEEYQDAHRKLAEAVNALESATFNARDFYPQGTQAWHQAKAERDEVFMRLKQVYKYLEAWQDHIADHV